MIWFWPIAIPLFVLLDVFMIWAIFKLIWSPWARSYPPQEPTPDAVTRRFQSFRFGSMNFGCCIHVAVDESHLHMTPLKPLRWVGAKPISVPWRSITIKKRSRNGKWVNAAFDGKTVTGPAWCLELAEPNEPSQTDDADEPSGDENDTL